MTNRAAMNVLVHGLFMWAWLSLWSVFRKEVYCLCAAFSLKNRIKSQCLVHDHNFLLKNTSQLHCSGCKQTPGNLHSPRRETEFHQHWSLQSSWMNKSVGEYSPPGYFLQELMQPCRVRLTLRQHCHLQCPSLRSVQWSYENRKKISQCFQYIHDFISECIYHSPGVHAACGVGLQVGHAWKCF